MTKIKFKHFEMIFKTKLTEETRRIWPRSDVLTVSDNVDGKQKPEILSSHKQYELRM